MNMEPKNAPLPAPGTPGGLVKLWEARSNDALPADAMLINRHIRELREVLNVPDPLNTVCRILEIAEDSEINFVAHVLRRLMGEGDAPLNVVLHCPACKRQHIDGYEDGEWTNRPHKTHLCHFCGCKWTAADRPTYGVRAIIPGSSATWPPADASLFSPAKLPVRDANGMTSHPDLPEIADEASPATWLWQIGHECRGVNFYDDVSQEVGHAYDDKGGGDCSAWTPSIPQGDGWCLAAIYDTEDGPYAMFVRPFPQLVPKPKESPLPAPGLAADGSEC